VNPAPYQSQVKISSMLIGAEVNSLLVEMCMMNDEQTQLKALLWTRFIPVNIQSGKRQDHPDDFMAFVRSIQVNDIDLSGGYDLRLKTLLGALKKETPKA